MDDATQSILISLEQNIKLKYNNGMQVCLDCLQHLCGRYEKKHALAHYEGSKHHISIQSKSLDLWCYSCDQNLQEMADIIPDGQNDNPKDDLVKFIDRVQSLFQKHMTGETILQAKPREEEKDLHIKNGESSQSNLMRGGASVIGAPAE